MYLSPSVFKTTSSSSFTTLITIDDVNLESFFEVAVRVIAPTLKPVIEKSSLIDAILSSLTDN